MIGDLAVLVPSRLLKDYLKKKLVIYPREQAKNVHNRPLAQVSGVRHQFERDVVSLTCWHLVKREFMSVATHREDRGKGFGEG